MREHSALTTLHTVLCRANNRFPTPLDATNQDDVYVGRIRRDISRPGAKGLELFVCGDQVRCCSGHTQCALAIRLTAREAAGVMLCCVRLSNYTR